MRVERKPSVSGFGECPLQRVARVGDRRLAVRGSDVTKHACGRVDLTAPRKYLESGRVGVCQHVRFVRSGEPLDRRSVESKSLGERAFHFRGGDRDAFQGANDVGKPESNELDSTFFNRAKNEITLLVHGAPRWCSDAALGRFAPHTEAPAVPLLGYWLCPNFAWHSARPTRFSAIWWATRRKFSRSLRALRLRAQTSLRSVRWRSPGTRSKTSHHAPVFWPTRA